MTMPESETLTEETVGTLDMTMFEEKLDEPLKCESGHHDPRSGECLVTARWKSLGCTGPILMCDHAAFFQQDLIRWEPKRRCRDCLKPLSECWGLKKL